MDKRELLQELTRLDAALPKAPWAGGDLSALRNLLPEVIRILTEERDGKHEWTGKYGDRERTQDSE